MKNTVLIFCLMAGYLVLFFQLGAMPFYGADEPRYAQIGQEMLQGGDYITPTLQQRPWLEKPPLLYWMEAGGYRLLGFTEMAARFPNALLALAAALLAGFLGWRVTRDAWTGVFAYLVLLSSLVFIVFGRAASTDMALTGPYALMLVAAFLAVEADALPWAMLAGCGGALAVLAKGPVGLVLGAGTVFIYLLALRRPPSGRILLGFTLSMLAVGLPWFVLVWLANGENFFLTFVVNHHIARFLTEIHHHAQPFWFYLPILVLGMFPWSFFLFPAGRDFLLRKRDPDDPEYRLRLFLWLWVLVPFLFFSLSSAKLPGYILPAIPALALLAALEWKRRIEQGDGRLSPALLAALVIVALGLAVALPIATGMEYSRPDIGLAGGIPLLSGVLLGSWWGRKKLGPSSFLAIAGGLIISMSALFAVGSPTLGRYHSTAELVSLAKPEISAEEPLVQYRFFHHTAIYYSGGRVTPDSINSPQEMMAYIRKRPQDTYILLTTSHGWKEFHALPGTEVVGPVGSLYLLKLSNRDRRLADRIRESLEPPPAAG